MPSISTRSSGLSRAGCCPDLPRSGPPGPPRDREACESHARRRVVPAVRVQRVVARMRASRQTQCQRRSRFQRSWSRCKRTARPWLQRLHCDGDGLALELQTEITSTRTVVAVATRQLPNARIREHGALQLVLGKKAHEGGANDGAFRGCAPARPARGKTHLATSQATGAGRRVD